MGLPTWMITPAEPSMAEREAFLGSSSASSTPVGTPRLGGHSFPIQIHPDPHRFESRRAAVPRRGFNKFALVLSVPALFALWVTLNAHSSAPETSDALGHGWEGTIEKGVHDIKEWGSGWTSSNRWINNPASNEVDWAEASTAAEAEIAHNHNHQNGHLSDTEQFVPDEDEHADEPPVDEPDEDSSPEVEDEDVLLEDELAVGAEDSDAEEEEVDVTAETIEVTALPRLGGPTDVDAKYLGFLPHSGYHNQRVAFQNALVLARMLNRTLLVPPVWIGWPIPAKVYGEMQQVWNDVVTMQPQSFGFEPEEEDSTLGKPAHYASTKAEFQTMASLNEPDDYYAKQQAEYQKMGDYYRELGYEVRPDGFPITNLTAKDCKSYSPECRHTYKDTFLAWDFLVDMKALVKKTGAPVVDRWDMRESSIEASLGVDRDDIFVIQDSEKWDFQFVDSAEAEHLPLIVENETSEKWRRNVSVPALRKLDHKVLLVGSMFGWQRVTTPDDEDESSISSFFEFARGLAFRNPWLIRPADAIRDRLGGPDGYVGVHARVGDGGFLERAAENMKEVWFKTAKGAGVSDKVANSVWDRVKPAPQAESSAGMTKLVRRSIESREPREPTFAEISAELDKNELVKREPRKPTWAEIDAEGHDALDLDAILVARNRHLAKRAQAESETRHHKLAKRMVANSKRDATELVDLTCRGNLHTAAHLLPFNTPVYLATDSRDPTNDVNLRPIFDAFPCTFILGDFDGPNEFNWDQPVEGISHMLKLVNKIDAVPLGRLFLPFLEATIAAKGFATAGTFGSTFSDFTTKEMWMSYREEWEAQQKGSS